ncbi:uncharacterized protein LOC127750077 [Frankliniella occidentalis]|uniref:Uncharacterized protein LOC127750077 n=1 Tax=Frankliniella occidentalis TaxID=133901 RepID=A0A9C6X0S9_FRAOC|nr:uncharacterized protein LOC127750077 [Frankliniella occidentalis]
MVYARGGLAEHLQSWQNHLCSTRGRNLTLLFLQVMRENWINLVLYPMYMGTTILDIIMAENTEATRLPIRAVIGSYSGFVSFGIFVKRRHIAQEALKRAAEVADTVEREAASSNQEKLQGEARTAIFRTRCLVIYSISAQVGVFLTLLSYPSGTAHWIATVAGIAGRLYVYMSISVILRWPKTMVDLSSDLHGGGGGDITNEEEKNLCSSIFL